MLFIIKTVCVTCQAYLSTTVQYEAVLFQMSSTSYMLFQMSSTSYN